MDVLVRVAGEEDLAEVRYIGFATWPPTYGDITGAAYVVGGLDEYWSAAAMAAAIGAGNVYVAEVGERIVGMTQVEHLGADLVMWKLYVLPEYQGTGAGRALLGEVKARAVAEGRALVTEHVAANARAGAFYLSQGFVVTETAKTPLDSVWMRFDG